MTKSTAFTTAAVAGCIVAASSLYWVYRSKHQRKLIDLRFDFSAREIRATTTKLLEQWKAIEDEVAAVPLDEVTYANSGGKLANLAMELGTKIANIHFLKNVAEAEEIRQAAGEAEERIDEFEVESLMRVDVYRVIKALAHTKDLAQQPPLVLRYVQRLIRDYERNGLHLSENERGQIREYKQRLATLRQQFERNMIEENTRLVFSREELDGLTEAFITSLEQDSETQHYFVYLKYPQVFPILRQCKVPQTRQKVEKAFNRRCIETNTKLLEEMVEIRHQKAQLQGFPTHAAFVLDIRMAKSPEHVAKFLDDLNDKLEPLAKQELDVLVRLKEKECESTKCGPFDGKINMYDFRYYMNKYEEAHYKIDHEVIREYFPIHVVTKNLLDIYQQLLQLRFQEVEKPHVWHKDVKLFAVFDARPAYDGNSVGFFYLDLFPRKGKYGHAACFGLQPSCRREDGTRQLPVAAMVANFSAPTADRPSLLQHSEVETYFHEFGHVMHQICSETKLEYFAGTRVERDFVESPSQMLENWCWEPASLKKLSGHYLDESKPLPDDLVKRLIATRNANTGLKNKRQILFAKFDQTIHTQPKADTATLLANLQREIMSIDATPGTNFAASFGHLAGGYDAQYYGYLWSEVYSMDMFMSRFKKEGLTNPKVGLDYRQYILARGGSMDAIDMLREFLGREPNDKAFLKSKGL